MSVEIAQGVEAGVKQRQGTVKWFITYLAVIAIAGVAIFLDIPLLRQFSGIAFLLLPGLLILLLLKLGRLGLAEKTVLTIGLSIAFLMLFGLVLNQVSLWVGYQAPISTLPLVVSLGLASLVLLIVAYLRNREAFLSNPFPIELNTRSKLCLLLPAVFPLLSIAGARLFQTADNNTILVALLFLIPLCVILFVWQRHKLSRDAYPLAIVMISASLLMYYWLVSDHILGSDVHYEYFFFQNTLLNQHWSIIEGSVLDSCLSISLLPAMFQSILRLPAEEQLFKGVYVLVASFTPLSIYVVSRKYLGETYALLAAFFFISHGLYLSAPGVPRVNVALFFFALFLMVLLRSNISRSVQTGLLISFMISTIVSHYATTYIFLFLLLGAYLIGLPFRKYGTKGVITQGSVLLFVVLIFTWYAQLTEVPFTTGVGFIRRIFQNLALFAVEEGRAQDVGLLVGEGLGEKPFLSTVNFVVTWATFVVIAIGVIGTAIKRREMLSILKWENTAFSFLKEKVDLDFFFLAAVSSAILVAVVVLPYVSIGYETGRAYGQMMVILSGFLVLGGMISARYLRINPLLLILIIIIPYHLFSTSVIYEATGVHGMSTLSSDAPGHTSQFVQEEEVLSAQWLKEYASEGSKVYAFDGNGTDKLISQGSFAPRMVAHYSSYQRSGTPGYTYLTYDNAVNGKFFSRGGLGDMSIYADEFTGKNKLYTNGGSEVWK